MSTYHRPYRAKRAFDLAILVTCGPAALVVGTLCAAAVKLTSPGPVLFRQQRAGQEGRPFVMLKFRTMTDLPDNPLIPDPSRITWVGKWLRRLSLDELPQLINVARGEMSIVGPRPAMPDQVRHFDDRQRLRLWVRPGMTGLAQVRGRNALSWASRIEHDLDYVDKQSLKLDMQILAATIRTVVGGRGIGGHPTDDPLLAEPLRRADRKPRGGL